MGFKVNFDLDKFRQEFLQSDGWKVSDCYKSYDDRFLRKDAQDAYEGAKWAWREQQKRIDDLQARVDAFKAQSSKLRESSKSCAYNEREKNILLSQADDIDQILGVEQALKGGEK